MAASSLQNNNILKKIHILITVCVLGSTLLKAQTSYIDSLLVQNKASAALKHIQIKKYNNVALKQLDKLQVFINLNKIDSSFYYLRDIDTTALSAYQKARYYRYSGEVHTFVNDEDIAFQNFQNSYNYFKKIGFNKKANEIVLKQFELLVSQTQSVTDPYPYLDLYGKNAVKNNWEDQLADYYFERGFDHFFTETNDSIFYYFNKAQELYRFKNDSTSLYRLNITKGTYYTELNKNIDSSLFYYNKAITYSNKEDDLYYVLINKANAHRLEERSDIAIELLEQARDYIPDNFKAKNYNLLYKFLSNNYDSIGNYKQSLSYLKKSNAYSDSLNYEAQNVNLIRYETAQKEKDNLILTAQKKRNQNIAILLGSFLLLGTIIAFLTYRNTKRKQRIAEQEKELEIQRTEKVLKEKEIETINAMVEGQEKERQRLAGDLHDSIGGTLAALKMHLGTMENTIDKKEAQKDLLSKANVLISDAYTRVRKIAHERNSGVMAKDGLLPAVQRLARNVSNGTLAVSVQDFGLEKRLHTDLEITIFRIVQELVTNVIKHAQATETIISLTQHEDELNIIIEDNGKGFKVGKLEEKEGMGLGSIERRVEHLDGSMVVDSTAGKGTNIIIDIPIK